MSGKAKLALLGLLLIGIAFLALRPDEGGRDAGADPSATAPAGAPGRSGEPGGPSMEPGGASIPGASHAHGHRPDAGAEGAEGQVYVEGQGMGTVVDPGEGAVIPDMPPSDPGEIPEPPPEEAAQTSGWRLGQTRRILGHLQTRIGRLEAEIGELERAGDSDRLRLKRALLERTRARVGTLSEEASGLEETARAEGTLGDAELGQPSTSVRRPTDLWVDPNAETPAEPGAGAGSGGAEGPPPGAP